MVRVPKFLVRVPKNLGIACYLVLLLFILVLLDLFSGDGSLLFPDSDLGLDASSDVLDLFLSLLPLGGEEEDPLAFLYRFLS